MKANIHTIRIATENFIVTPSKRPMQTAGCTNDSTLRSDAAGAVKNPYAKSLGTLEEEKPTRKEKTYL